jgi:hypothetical protein
MMSLKGQHSKEKYASNSSAIINLKQFCRHINNLNTRYGIIQVIEVVHGNVELTQSICLFFVGNVEHLVHEDGEYCHDKAPPFSRRDYAVGDEERDEGEY